MRRHALAACITLAALAFAGAPASAGKVGDEFQVNTATVYTQYAPSIAKLSDGGFVVVWASHGQKGRNWDVFGQRYNAKGRRRGKEFRVNSYTLGIQDGPSVAGLSDGGFVVAWRSRRKHGSGAGLSVSGVFGQRYNTDGKRVGEEFQVNTTIPTMVHTYRPSIAGLNAGGFVVVWELNKEDGSGSDVYGRRYGSTGTPAGGEFRVNTHRMNSQDEPSVAGLGDGGFVVVWTSQLQDGDDRGIFGQRYGVDGTPIGAEFQVNTHTDSGQFSPSVAGLGDGGFVVVWTSSNIFAQRYDADGQKILKEFRVNTRRSGTQEQPSAAGLSDGGFVVAWTSFSRRQDGSLHGIYGQRYNAVGERVKDEFQVNTYTDGTQKESALTGLDNALYVIVWDGQGQEGHNEILGQRFK